MKTRSELCCEYPGFLLHQRRAGHPLLPEWKAFSSPLASVKIELPTKNERVF